MKDVLRRRDGETAEELHAKILAYEVDFRRQAADAFAGRRQYRLLAERLAAVDALWERYADALERTVWLRGRKLFNQLLQRSDGLSRPALSTLAEDADDDFRYADWLARNAPRDSDIERMRTVAPCLRFRPTISVVMPVFEPPEPFFRAAIESVIGQAYPYWELCVVDDASPSEYVADVVHEYAAAEPRIRFARHPQNGHIARASNTALGLARGEFVALLDHDDLLQADALFEVAVALNERPELDFIYSDEDKVDALGCRAQPSFKPDWAPDTFLTKMYTSHLATFRRTLVDEVGGFRDGFEGAQDYDLVLRITERTSNIHHIAKVLYSWRLHHGSVSENPTSKSYAYASSLRALESAMERRGEGGTVSRAPMDIGHWIVRYTIKSYDKVSVIVPTRNGAQDVRRCLDSLFACTAYPSYEVILLDNGSDRYDALALFAAYEEREPYRFRYVRHDVRFNFAAINNFATRSAHGNYLLFLNNDTKVLHPDWMAAMVEQAQRPSIGAVGAKLIYEDDTLQHAGVVLGVGGAAGHSHRHLPRDAGGYMNNVALTTNYSAVTAACMMIRRNVFDQVGGFDETFAVAYNDVDLCLRLREAGYYNVYLPHVELYHYESRSRGYDIEPEQIERDRRERIRLHERWQQAWSRDPFYNPHLSLTSEDFRLAP